MKKLMAANWKMYKTGREASQTADELVSLVQEKLPTDREVLVFPPFTALGAVADAFSGRTGFSFGAQNFYPAEHGAYTGEIAPRMLEEYGCAWLLAGHSERRWVFGETDDIVNTKVLYGLEHGFKVILCVGEKIEERKAGQVEQVLFEQLEKGLLDVASSVDPGRLAVAYEPVWAIGTGETAGPAEIAEAHEFVRQKLESLFSGNGAQMPILYGGSVKPDNASEIIALDNVDGVLVGGASLTADSFAKIVLA